MNKLLALTLATGLLLSCNSSAMADKPLRVTAKNTAKTLGLPVTGKTVAPGQTKNNLLFDAPNGKHKGWSKKGKHKGTGKSKNW